MPVESHMESGVVVESSGERMVREGPQVPSMKPCFWWVTGWVPPARLEYSPPLSEVGMLRMGRVEGLLRATSGCVIPPVVSLPKDSRELASLARA